MGWKARSLERSLEVAKARSLERGSRFVAAARELALESQQLDFTVQEVVARSELSLRSFYQHFEGKEELLLALYEELVSDAARRAAAKIESIGEPIEQLRVLVCRFYATRGAFPSPLDREIQRILQDRPGDVRLALEPLVALFAEVIQRAIEAGIVREGSARDHAVHLLLVVMAHTQARSKELMGHGWPVFSREQLWVYCRRSLGVE